MGESFGYRHDHLMPFMKWAEIVNVDIRELYAFHFVNCLKDGFKDGCGVSWIEYDWQVQNRPSRMSLAQRLYEAEIAIGHYLKSPVGPTYVHGEMHTTFFVNHNHRSNGYYNGHHLNGHGPSLRIQTRWRNVIKTGTQALTSVGAGLPQNRRFIDRRGWDFDEDIIYCIGDHENPLSLDWLDQNELDNLCNLRIYQPGFGPITDSCQILVQDDGNVCYLDNWTGNETDFQHSHRIRPFHATYDGGQLCIQINKMPNARLELYSGLPHNPKYHLEDLDFCDEDTFPERMEVYNVSYEKPDGVAYLRKQPCVCTSGCDACDMREVPICLVPVDPINGEFDVFPIVDTSDPDTDDCCWELSSWTQCCYDLYGDWNQGCGCDIPVVICINYVASACGNWDDCCLIDGVCPDLEASVAYLAASWFDSICECGCLDALFSKYSMDMMIALAERRSGSVIYEASIEQYVFGSTWGAHQAFLRLRHRDRVHDPGNWFIG